MAIRAGITLIAWLTVVSSFCCVSCARTEPSASGLNGTVFSSSTDSAAVLTSLSTFVTSGAGYSDYVPKYLGLRQQLPTSAGVVTNNSSGSGERTHRFNPTPPHKPLWPRWNQRDVWLFSLAAITLFVAAGGGIGGGAVFVPLYIIVGDFTAAQAVALSNITILGGAVANFIANSGKRHSFRNTPLIDWDLIMVMEPTTMLGALLGSYTNKLFPTWFTSCLMAALLMLLTWKLLTRGVLTFISETREQRLDQLHPHHGSGSLTAPLLANDHDQDAAQGAAGSLDGVEGASDTTRDTSKQHSARGAATAAAGPAGDGAGAWMDAGAAADQCPAGPAAPGDGNDGDISAAADATVVPVPAGLKPVALGRTSTAAGPAGPVGNTPQPSGGSFSVEDTPKLLEQHQAERDDITSPLLWSNPSSATAVDAEAAAGCPFGQHARHKQQHQQRRRQALLLPRHNTARGDRGSSSSSSSDLKHPWRLCCFCSCLNPSRLQLSTIQAYAEQQLPWQPLLTLFLLSCWVVASDTGKATLPCGSLSYWATVLSVVPPCLLVTLVVRQWLLAKTAVEAAAVAAATSGSRAAEVAAVAAAQQRKSGIIQWTPRNSITYPLLCSLAGVFAGLFGVGGGIVKGPLMLELGVLPDVAAATSATMIAFTAGSAAIVYLNFGGVVMDYAQALLLLGFVVTLAGQMVSTHLVKVLRRRSIIIFAMGLLMLLASIAAVYQMGLSTWTAYEHPPMWNWGSVCQHR